MLQTKPLASQITPLIQRQPLEEEEEELEKKSAGDATLIQKQPLEEEEEELQMKSAKGGDAAVVASDMQNRVKSLRGGGKPLSQGERGYFEPRFGCDFSGVRIHDDNRAAEMTSAVNAQAFTYGNNIVFGPGKYSPQSAAGKQLLAHELTHTIQQNNSSMEHSSNPDTLRLAVSFDDCTSSQETLIQDTHERAIEMCGIAITKLGAYNGTAPADVRDALNRHFHATSSAFAGWIRLNLRYLKWASDSPQYECESVQIGSRMGWAMWCVPFSDIELYPRWFALADIDRRARWMIHEWVHRYGCNFDLGYAWEEGYSGHGTARSLINADPWAKFIYDIC
ncbi:MAG: DUF4157 domain-containing protein [Desulfobulbaceae bacterium]|nr:DUF4157 domain-containing protein [Desulfobulbaceae bacterium]